MSQNRVRSAFIGKVGLQNHGIECALADHSIEGGGLAGTHGGDLGVGPMAGDVVREPLQALRVAAHDNNDWTARICHNYLNRDATACRVIPLGCFLHVEMSHFSLPGLKAAAPWGSRHPGFTQYPYRGASLGASKGLYLEILKPTPQVDGLSS